MSDPAVWHGLCPHATGGSLQQVSTSHAGVPGRYGQCMLTLDVLAVFFDETHYWAGH